MSRETPLFKAFTWRDRKALDLADSFGNRSVCREALALLQAAVGRFNGRQGGIEIARSMTSAPVRQPVSLKRRDGLLHPEPS